MWEINRDVYSYLKFTLKESSPSSWMEVLVLRLSQSRPDRQDFILIKCSYYHLSCFFDGNLGIKMIRMNKITFTGWEDSGKWALAPFSCRRQQFLIGAYKRLQHWIEGMEILAKILIFDVLSVEAFF